MRRTVPLARIWAASLGAAAVLLFLAAWLVDRDPGVVAEAQALADANALAPQLEAAAEVLRADLAHGRAPEIEASMSLAFDVDGRLVRPAPIDAPQILRDASTGGEASLPSPAASWLQEANALLGDQDWGGALEAVDRGLESVRADQQPASWAGLMLARAEAQAGENRIPDAVATLIQVERATSPNAMLDGRPLRLLTRFRLAELWQRAKEMERAREVRGELLQLLLEGRIPIEPGRLRFYVGMLGELSPASPTVDPEVALDSFELAAEIQRQLARDPQRDSLVLGTRVALLDRAAGVGRLYPLQEVHALVADRLQSMLPESGAFQLVSGGAQATGPVKSNLRLSPAFGHNWRLILARPAVYQRPAVRRRQFLFAGAGVVILALAVVGVWGARALRRRAELDRLRSEFVAGVSHELRTPAASIALLATNLAEGRISDPQRRQQYFDALRRDSRRLQRLVADVLDVSRLERGSFEVEPIPLDPRALLLPVIDDLRPRLRDSGMEIEVDCADDLPLCPLDPDAVERVIANLLENARKYAAGGGVVQVRVFVRGMELWIEVEDRGPGIPTALRERVFRAFERGAPEGGLAGGAGLGLALVHQTLEAHGGHVDLEHGKGHGSLTRGALFRLRFPLSSD